MPIPVTCPCGKQVSAPDHLAGKRVKCPQCSNPLDIPAAEAGVAELMSEAGMTSETSCPSCGAELDRPDAVLCVECGYDLQSGKQIKGVRPKGKGQGGVTDELLARAEEALDESPVRAEGAYGGKYQEWILMAICVGVLAAIVAGGVLFFNHMEKKYQDEDENAGQQYSQPGTSTDTSKSSENLSGAAGLAQ